MIINVMWHIPVIPQIFIQLSTSRISIHFNRDIFLLTRPDPESYWDLGPELDTGLLARWPGFSIQNTTLIFTDHLHQFYSQSQQKQYTANIRTHDIIIYVKSFQQPDLERFFSFYPWVKVKVSRYYLLSSSSRNLAIGHVRNWWFWASVSDCLML